MQYNLNMLFNNYRMLNISKLLTFTKFENIIVETISHSKKSSEFQKVLRVGLNSKIKQ